MISGTTTVTKTGIWELTLNGDNTYTGATNINEGPIRLGHNNALGESNNPTVVADGGALHLNGVSTKDIVLLQKYLLGKSDINSPYKMIAADVNNTGSITTSDISELRKLVLGKIDEFRKVPSWKFMEKSFKFSDEKDPFIDIRSAL